MPKMCIRDRSSSASRAASWAAHKPSKAVREYVLPDGREDVYKRQLVGLVGKEQGQVVVNKISGTVDQVFEMCIRDRIR